MSWAESPTIRAGLVLAGVAAICGLIVTLSYALTAKKITDNERLAKLERLNQLVPPLLYNNDFLQDTLIIEMDSGEPITMYRARRDGKPVAVAFQTIVPDGYNGRIDLLLAIRYDGVLLGARVLNHRETPGLGDDIDQARSHWVYEFSGRSLNNPPPNDWAVKKDGGIFDQFTGATISPRAVVKGIKRSLIFFEENRTRLFTGN